MRRYLSVRVMWAIPTLFGIVLAGFVLTRVLPGDPAQILVGDFPAPPGYIEEIRARYGLDQSYVEQFVAYISSLLHADLGYSFMHGQPVTRLVFQRAGWTLLIMVPALVIASVVGVFLGSAAARRQGTKWDTLITAFAITGRSVPVFWLAILLVMVFAVRLGWFPTSGMRTVGSSLTGLGAITDVFRHMVLPMATLSLAYTTVVARVARTSIVESSHEDFVDTALAKGLDDRAVHWRHVVRNSLIPVVTVIGFNFGFALTGAILTETVFGWPGVGSLLITAVTARDYPVILAVLLLAAVMVVVFNLVTDLAYVLIDPRAKVSDEA